MKNSYIKHWWNWHQQSISSTFYSLSFSYKILTPKITKLKESCTKHFRFKKALVKYWWNWLQQSISSTIYDQVLSWYSFAKKSQSQTVIREKLHKALSYKKASTCNMLIKLTLEPLETIQIIRDSLKGRVTVSPNGTRGRDGFNQSVT